MLGSCNPEEQKSDKVETFYDLKGFALAQIDLLERRKPLVKKVLQTDGQSESRSTKDINWKKELELLIQADINKPAYRKSYEIVRPDSLTLEYRLKAEEGLTVKLINIKFDQSTGKPSKVHALLISKNQLYESKKDIEFHCASIGGEWLISSYHVKGFQKLSILSAKTFDITGKMQF